MIPRRTQPYLLVILIAYVAAVFISPDLFGLPPNAVLAINLAMIVVITISAILLIRDLIK